VGWLIEQLVLAFKRTELYQVLSLFGALLVCFRFQIYRSVQTTELKAYGIKKQLEI